MDTQRFIKRTSNGKTLHVTFSDGGELREWSDGSTEADSWGGTWRSNTVKSAVWFVEIRIGDWLTHFELQGDQIVGVEKSATTGEEMALVTLISASETNITAMGRLQGHGAL